MMPLNEKTILITGGTGSFGKRMVQKILSDFSPKKLIIYSRDELKQFEMSQRWSESKYPCIKYIIGDIRDKERLNRIFHNVDFVIHAAALKQVPAAEYNPSEAIKTNVLGTMNIIEAALSNNVKKVVSLSTDKACSPINLYGATKLCADKLITAAYEYDNKISTSIFSVVRYGNVIGSRGSVVPFFKERAKTGILPITDSQMTRFFITLDEAVNFVLKVLEISQGGEIFVPKIPSMRITDLASAVAPECKQEIVGIRPGEKLHELLISKDDAHNTLEFENYFEIYPPHLISSRMKGNIKGEKCQENFEYSSNSNDKILTTQELRDAITKINFNEFIPWTLDEVPR